MLTKPKRFDVIRVSSLKKIDIKKSEQESQWIINLNAPVEVIKSDLTQTLGAPQEINTIKSSAVDFNQTIEIPAEE